MNKKNESLSWDDFVKLGNPENAPDLPEEDTNDEDVIKNNQMSNKRLGGVSKRLSCTRQRAESKVRRRRIS